MNGSKYWEIALKALVPISVIIGSVLIGHEVRIGKIEDSRFTSTDGERLGGDLKEYVRLNSVPEWLRDDITHLQEHLDRIEDAIRAVEAQMASALKR